MFYITAPNNILVKLTNLKRQNVMLKVPRRHKSTSNKTHSGRNNESMLL